MNPDTLKTKWKKNAHGKWSDGNTNFDDMRHRDRVNGLPQEKYGKRKFKIQREVDDYFSSLH